jgi:hypothetical protein
MKRGEAGAAKIIIREKRKEGMLNKSTSSFSD